MKMLMRFLFVLLAIAVVHSSVLPSRVKRQGFNWGDYDNEEDQSTSSRPTRPSAPTTPATADGTTTASPQFTSCMRNCPVTPQYNPVCGNNRVTYNNDSHLRCANRCGLTVERLFIGSCSPL